MVVTIGQFKFGKAQLEAWKTSTSPRSCFKGRLRRLKATSASLGDSGLNTSLTGRGKLATNDFKIFLCLKLPAYKRYWFFLSMDNKCSTNLAVYLDTPV